MVHRITRWLLFLTGVTLPITEGEVFVVGPLVFALNKVVTGVLLGWASLYWLATRYSFPRDRKAVWVALFGVAIAISLLMSGVPMSRVAVAVMAMSAILLFYFLLVYVTVDFRSLDHVLVGYLIGVTITSISVLMGYGVEAGDRGTMRTGGFGGDPNHFSYDAAVAVPIALMYFTMTRSHLSKFILIGFIALAVVSVMATLSRSGVVELVAVLALWMFRFRRFDVLRIAIPIGAVAVAAALFSSSAWVDRMLTIGAVVSEDERADGAVLSRLIVGEYSMWALVANPLFGVGYQNFGGWAVSEVRQYRQSGRGDVLANSNAGMMKAGGAIHNSYLHVAAEMGLVGLISYLTLLALGWLDFSRGFRTAKKFPDDAILSRAYSYAIFLQMSFLATLVGNMFLSSVRFRSAWLVLAVSTVILRVIRNRMAELAGSPAASSEVSPLPGLEGPSRDFMPASLSPKLPGRPPGRPG